GEGHFIVAGYRGQGVEGTGRIFEIARGEGAANFVDGRPVDPAGRHHQAVDGVVLGTGVLPVGTRCLVRNAGDQVLDDRYVGRRGAGPKVIEPHEAREGDHTGDGDHAHASEPA